MPKKLNLLNQKFGKLTVISEAPNRGGRTYWLCQCECGNTKEIQTDSLRSGRTNSCGCLRKDTLIQNNKNRIIDLVGQKFGLLTVVEQVESYRNHSAWLCQCDCGRTKIVNSVELKHGDTLSCGCLKNSFGAKSIQNILEKNNIPFKTEYTFDDLKNPQTNKNLYFDFAIFDNNNNLKYLIEYDGEQHYLDKTKEFWKDDLETRQKRDQLKNQYCKDHNIDLYRIPYWDKNNISLESLTDEKYKVM